MKATILRECVRIAREKNERRDGNFRHFSFVIQKNKIVEFGMNVGRAKPPLYFGYPEKAGIHAETFAYKKAKGLLRGEDFEMLNIRLNRSGELKLSKPCPCCYALLQTVGCKAVWFSVDGGEFAKLKL